MKKRKQNTGDLTQFERESLELQELLNEPIEINGKKIEIDCLGKLQEYDCDDPVSLQEQASKAPVWFAYYATLKAKVEKIRAITQQEFDDWYATIYGIERDSLSDTDSRVSDNAVRQAVLRNYSGKSTILFKTDKIIDGKNVWEPKEFDGITVYKDKIAEYDALIGRLDVLSRAFEKHIALLPTQISLMRAMIERSEIYQMRRPEVSSSEVKAGIGKEKFEGV